MSISFPVRVLLDGWGRVRSASVVPNDAFVLILLAEQSVFFEGDERSRTNPGHGYPARTETYDANEVYATTDRPLMERTVELLFKDDPRRTDVIVFRPGSRVSVTSSVVIAVS